MHDGQRFRLEIGQRTQDAFGLSRVRHVTGEWSLLHLFHRSLRRLDQVRRRYGGHVPK